MALRDKLGHFVRTALAAPVEPEAAAGVIQDQAEDELDDLVPVLPQTHADLRAQIAALREQRAELLVVGDLDAIAAIDSEVARLEVAGESLIARSQAAAAAAVELEHARRIEAWRQVQPRLEAARTARNEAALRLCETIDTCAAIEAEASGVANIVGIALGDFTPTEAMTRFLLESWATAGHARRLGQASRAA